MPQLNAKQPIVEADRTMSQPMRERMREVGNAIPLTGTGSPEGVVEALQAQLYIDLSGGAGTMLYVKKDAALAGDTTQGWVAV